MIENTLFLFSIDRPLKVSYDLDIHGASLSDDYVGNGIQILSKAAWKNLERADLKMGIFFVISVIYIVRNQMSVLQNDLYFDAQVYKVVICYAYDRADPCLKNICTHLK